MGDHSDGAARLDNAAGGFADDGPLGLGALDDFAEQPYDDVADRVGSFLGSIPLTVVLAAGSAGMAIGVFLNSYQ